MNKARAVTFGKSMASINIPVAFTQSFEIPLNQLNTSLKSTLWPHC